MSRRTSKTVRKTPLSALDKLIYFILWVIGTGAICCVPIILGRVIPERIAYSDPTAIACNTDVALFYTLPLMFALMIFIFFILGYAGEHKLPIFGNNTYKPKTFERVIPTYPLFSKDFSRNFTDKSKKNIKRFFCIMIIAIIITAVFLPFGTHRRLTLDRDDTVRIYDSFNRCETYQWTQAEDVSVGIEKIRRGGVNLVFRFEYNRDHYEFRIRSFKNMSRYEVLKYMLYLKENTKDFTVGSTRRLERLINEDYYTAAEQQLLYQLFDYTP